MKTTKILMVAATLIVALSLAAPASASCGTVASISTIVPGGGGTSGTTFVFSPPFQEYGITYGPGYAILLGYNAGTPAPPPVSAAATVSFWALGLGDPAIGSGTDNGSFDMIAAGQFYGYGYPSSAYYPGGYWQAATIDSTWEPAGIDGCIGSGNCMCLLISDHDGERGFWAVTGGESNANFNTVINQGGSDGNGNNLPIVLVTMDKPSITGSVRQPNFDVDLTVKLAAPTAGDYTNDLCNCAPIGYKVLQQVVIRGNMPPTDRSLSAWSEPALAAGGVQGVTAFGDGVADAGVTVRSVCGATNNDVYLTAQLVFDSGFATTVVSGNSARVECGPTLADPDDRPSRIRPRSDRPTSPRRR